MCFTINTWLIIFTVLYLLIIILEFLFIESKSKNEIFKLCIILILVISDFVGMGFLFNRFCGNFVRDNDNVKISIGKYVNYVRPDNMFQTNGDIEYFKDMDEITGYIDKVVKDSVSEADYYYDDVTLNATYKTLNFLDLMKYLKSHDKSLLYNINYKENKKTEKLELNGTLSSTTKNGQVKYLIDDYVLDEDDNKKIESLANNLNVHLDIVYDKEQYNNDKHLMKYTIINYITN